jgi:CcmD family protein
MINTLKKITVLLASLLVSAGAFAQDAIATSAAPVEMATGLYQSGKIYVVVVVLAVIMAGIFGYLVMLDRKVSRLEKENRSL